MNIKERKKNIIQAGYKAVEELVKVAKSEVEKAKVSIRNARKDANNEIRKSDFSEDLKSNYEQDIQDLTDKFISMVDSILAVKEKEILSL